MTRPADIVIRNWGKFQHYKKRNPPWIRLYRDLIDGPEWRNLSDGAARLLIELWLLASELDPGGRVPCDMNLLAWRTGRASTDASANASMGGFLQELALQGFIRIPKFDASMDASANASKSTPQRQRTEAEAEPTHSTREDGEPDRLAGWLGEFACILDDCPPAEDPVTRNTLFMQYGPPGMRAKAWALPDGSSVPEAERPRIFALALSGYAGEGKTEIVNAEFSGVVRSSVRDECSPAKVTTESKATGFTSTDADFEPGGIYGPPADA